MANKKKYLSHSFTIKEFNTIMELVDYIYEKWNEFYKEVPDKKIIMKGQLWKFFLKEKEEIMKHPLYVEDDEDHDLLDEPEGEDKFFAKKLMT